jgi:hypothetical protein
MNYSAGSLAANRWWITLEINSDVVIFDDAF